MNNRILFLPLLLLFILSCNSNKKSVSNNPAEGDFSNYKRVGTVDTSKSVTVTPGNEASVDAYVNFISSGIKSIKQRSIKEDAGVYDIIVAGKINSVDRIQKNVNLGTSRVTTNYYFRDNQIIYAEEITVKTGTYTSRTTKKYYFKDGKVLSAKQEEDLGTRDENGQSVINIRPFDSPENLTAPVLSELEILKSKFGSMEPFEGRVVRQGDNYAMTGCIDNKSYSLTDKAGELKKAFTEGNVGDGTPVMVNFNGMPAQDMKSISVIKVNYTGIKSGKNTCF